MAQTAKRNSASSAPFETINEKTANDVSHVQLLPSRKGSDIEQKVTAIKTLIRDENIDSAVIEASKFQRELITAQSEGGWSFTVQIGMYLRSHAQIYGDIGTAEGAVSLLKAAVVSISPSQRAEHDHLLGLAFTTLGDLGDNKKYYDQAAELFRNALNWWGQVPGSAIAIRCSINLAEVLAVREDNRAYLEEGLAIIDNVIEKLGPTSVDYQRALGCKGGIIYSIERLTPLDERANLSKRHQAGAFLYYKLALGTRIPKNNVENEWKIIRANILLDFGRICKLNIDFDSSSNYIAQSIELFRSVGAYFDLSKARIDLGSAQMGAAILLIETNTTGYSDLFDSSMRLSSMGLEYLKSKKLNARWRREVSALAGFFSELAARYQTSKSCEIRRIAYESLTWSLNRYEELIPTLEEVSKSTYSQAYIECFERLFYYSDIIQESGINIGYNVAYSPGVDKTIFEIAARIRAELLAAGLPTAEWSRVFALLQTDLVTDRRRLAREIGSSRPGGMLDNVTNPAATDFDHSQTSNANRLLTDPALAAPLQPSRRRRSSINIKTPLPDLPPGYSWPGGDYGDSAEGKGKAPGGIIAYLTRVWLPILEAGRRDGRIYVDRRNIAQHYPGVIIAMKNFTKVKKKTKEKGYIPEKLIFPSESVVNDYLISTITADAIRKEPRLAQVITNRVKKTKQQTPT